MATSSLERRSEALRLREAGLSYAEIGRRWGITKERVRQIVKGKPSRKKAPRVMLMPVEVAQMLGIHTNTVRRWENQGILKAYRVTSRGDRRFRREEIDNFLAARIINH